MIQCESIDKSVKPCRYFISPMQCSLSNNFLCIEAKQRKAPKISHSELTTYGKCYRMWWYSYYQGLELIKPPVRLLAGRIFGECLAALVSNKPKTTWKEIINNYEQIYTEGEIPKELTLISAWTMALENGWAYIEEKGIAEYEFLTKDLDYPQVHGYLDLVRLDGDGKPSYAKEFKYSGNPDGWSKFTLGNQLATYFWGLPSIERIEVGIFKVPGLRQKKGEEAEEYRDRVIKDITYNKLEYLYKQNYYRNEFDLAALKRRYGVMTTELYNRLGGGIDAFYLTDNRETCFRCDYLQICSNDGIVSEQLYKKKEIKHEETV